MNTLDLIVVGVIAVSALLAFFRGLVREVLAIAAWAGATAAAFYLTAPTRGFFRSFISATWAADIVGPIVLFIVALVVLSLITSVFTAQIRNSQLNSLDRTLGLLFGAARGMLLVCIGYICLNYFIPPDTRPDWIKQARTLPYLDQGSKALIALVPKDIIEHGGKAAERVVQKAQQAQKLQQDMNDFAAPPSDQAPQAPVKQQSPTTPPATPPNYSDGDSRQLDQVIQNIQNKP